MLARMVVLTVWWLVATGAAAVTLPVPVLYARGEHHLMGPPTVPAASIHRTIIVPLQEEGSGGDPSAGGNTSTNDIVEYVSSTPNATYWAVWSILLLVMLLLAVFTFGFSMRWCRRKGAEDGRTGEDDHSLRRPLNATRRGASVVVAAEVPPSYVDDDFPVMGIVILSTSTTTTAAAAAV